MLEEAEREREKWLVIEDHTQYCLVCNEPVIDVDEHERTTTHFQAWLLVSMGAWFAEQAEAAKSEEETVQGWTLVASRKKKYQHTKKGSKLDLKGTAGQL